MQRAAYQTRQQRAMQTWLEQTAGQPFTAGQLRAALGESVSTATVYRYLERLVAEGRAAKYTLEGEGARFEYLDAAPAGLHCKCERCGQLLRIRCEQARETGRHLLAGHGFAVDPRRTVVYGVCAACRETGL